MFTASSTITLLTWRGNVLANAQYSRRQRVDIVGIPTSVPDNGLEKPF